MSDPIFLKNLSGEKSPNSWLSGVLLQPVLFGSIQLRQAFQSLEFLFILPDMVPSMIGECKLHITFHGWSLATTGTSHWNMHHNSCWYNSLFFKKKTTPNSTNIEMIGPKLVIPGKCKCWVARDVLTILNTKRPLNIVFTVRDKEKESIPIGVNQGRWFLAFCGPSLVNEHTLSQHHLLWTCGFWPMNPWLCLSKPYARGQGRLQRRGVTGCAGSLENTKKAKAIQAD